MHSTQPHLGERWLSQRERNSPALNLLHRLAFRFAQGLLAYGALLPWFIQEGAMPSLPGVALGSAYVLVMLVLPKPLKVPEKIDVPRRKAPPLMRALQFLV